MWRKLRWVLLLAAAIWAIEALNILLGYSLNAWFGLIPRRLGGVDGIVLMPLLHGSVTHALSNTVPLLILGGLLALTANRPLLAVNAVIVLGGGLAVWLFGARAIHVGASGLVFGWFGFLSARGVVDRQPVQIVVAILVVLLYGTMVWGVLPGQPGVSWEGHLFGALAGIAAAILIRADLRR